MSSATGRDWYQKRLGSAYWKALRTKCFERDGWCCTKCGESGDDSRLHAHHISYLRLGRENEINDLVTLCAKCHKVEHDVPAYDYDYYRDIYPDGIRDFYDIPSVMTEWQLTHGQMLHPDTDKWWCPGDELDVRLPERGYLGSSVH